MGRSDGGVGTTYMAVTISCTGGSGSATNTTVVIRAVDVEMFLMTVACVAAAPAMLQLILHWPVLTTRPHMLSSSRSRRSDVVSGMCNCVDVVSSTAA